MTKKQTFLIGGLIVLMAGIATAAELPAIEMAKVAKGDLPAGFSEVRTVDGVSCRVLTGDRRQMVKLPAWWDKGSLRPAEGSQVVFDIRYKDTVKAPVVFYSHSGLGRYQSPTEMHRFGGAGDGKWKTAECAVGWDQIMRLLDDRGKTAIGFSAAGDVAIASIKVRPAKPADAERHNAETRAWIKAVQADKAVKARPAVKPRSFLVGKKLAAVVAFPWPALMPLMDTDQPSDKQVAAPVKIRMCLNELEGGSFGVYANGADLTNVTYVVGDLAGPGGKLAADVIPRTAEYCVVGGQKWFPQRLWPAHAVDIDNGRSHWFVFNLKTRRGRTRPGVYKGTVTIKADQGRSTLPVEVEVLDIDLLTMSEAGLFMGGCVTGLVPAHDFEFSLDYNQNGINLWYAGVRPGAKIVDEKLVLDFTILDEWMASAKKRGLVGNVWFLGGCPYGFPNTMSIFRHMAQIDTREGHKPMTTSQFNRMQSKPENRNRPMAAQRELAVEWVRQVAAHAKANNWPEVILTPFDEPAMWVQGPYKKSGSYKDSKDVIGTGPWIKSYFKDGCKIIREGAPDIRVYGSIHHIDYRRRGSGLAFINDVDVFCTNAYREDPKIGEKVRAAGNTLWQYTGVGGGRNGPDRARYAFGFFFAASDSRGSLAWAYNWGSGFDTTVGRNWMYAWQTPFDVIPAPYYEGMREAWDDRRVIETYKKKLSGDPEAMALLAKILKEAPASRSAGGTETVSDFWAGADDASKMGKWRRQLLDRLVKGK